MNAVGLTLAQPRFFSKHDGIIPASVGTPNGFLVFTTHDAGVSWHSQPFVAVDYNALYQQSLKPGDFNDLVYRTTPAPQFATLQFGWAGHPGLKLFLTSDSGQHWQPLTPRFPLQDADQLQFISSTIGWIVIKGESSLSSRLYKTSDGGQTWAPLSSTLA
jgi:photosystem II stability/assembly factor-like uncharacterized protein